MVYVQSALKSFIQNLPVKSWKNRFTEPGVQRMLEHRIKDRKIINLIKRRLKADILDASGMTINPATETPQGGVISLS